VLAGSSLRRGAFNSCGRPACELRVSPVETWRAAYASSLLRVLLRLLETASCAGDRRDARASSICRSNGARTSLLSTRPAGYKHPPWPHSKAPPSGRAPACDQRRDKGQMNRSKGPGNRAIQP
jgi:hypothetical protein